jgi:hypothetical protein
MPDGQIPEPLFKVGQKVTIKSNLDGVYELSSRMWEYAGQQVTITSVSEYQPGDYPTYRYTCDPGKHYSWAQEAFVGALHAQWRIIRNRMREVIDAFSGMENTDEDVVAVYQTCKQLYALLSKKAGGYFDG